MFDVFSKFFPFSNFRIFFKFQDVFEGAGTDPFGPVGTNAGHSDLLGRIRMRSDAFGGFSEKTYLFDMYAALSKFSLE